MLDKPHQSSNELQKMVDLAWRRKWVILIPFFVVSMTITLFGLYLPNLYRSSATILIEPQKVPKDYVRSTITIDIGSRLRTISQQLSSRTKILKVIEELDLYPEAREKNLPHEVLVSLMRKDLEVETPDNLDQSFFVVKFIHKDPNKAMLGVSRLISLFIEENLLLREQQAAGTTLFIEEELISLKKILEKQEADIKSYKMKHMGELPDQLESNLRMLDNLQLQFAENQESQREMENRVLLLEQEIAKYETQIQIPTIMDENDIETPVNATLFQLLAQRDTLRQKISNMESTYTSHHPDLITIRKELSQIENKIRVVQKSMVAQTKNPITITPSSPSFEFTRETTFLRNQLNESKPRLAALFSEESDLRKRINRYQARVEAAPRREQELLSLTRDYVNTKSNYDDLLNKKQEAQLSENLEKRQKGEKFRILDTPNLPERPYLPNRLKIILMGLLGGLGLGLGLAFMLEALFPVYYDLAPLKDILSVPIIMSIPDITTPSERRRSKIRFLLWTGASIGLLVSAMFLLDRYVVDLTGVAKQIGTNIRSIRL